MSIFRQEVLTTVTTTKIDGDNKFINVDSYTKKWFLDILYYYHHGYEYQVDSRVILEKSAEFLKK